jgi:hypothetical protein
MNIQDESKTFVLEAAINGITESYLAENDRVHDPFAVSESINMLVLNGMLSVLADKHRNFKAYKTTALGLRYLMKIKSLHGTSSVFIEA